MPEAPSISNWKRRTNISLFVGFMMLLWLPAADTFFHFDHSSIPGENRLPAEFPKFNSATGGVKKFIAGLDAYYNDHFGFRSLLIWSFRSGTTHLLNDQKGQQSVIVGRDGWLYFCENQMVEHYRGTLLFTPDQLADWKSLLEHDRDWMAQRGIKFVFVIAPDKQSIYPEYLPAWMTKVSPETKLDQFFAYMKEHSTVDVVDLRPKLLAGRSSGPMYYQTDSHWNLLGSFLAYQTLVNELAGQKLARAKPMALEAFDRSCPPCPPGDLNALAGSDTPESNNIVFKPKPPLQPLEPVAQPNVPGMPFVTSNPEAGGTVFVYGDSFVNGWVPFLGYNFNQVYYFKNQFLAAQCMDTHLLEQARPTVVILEVIERSFNVAKPIELLAEEK